MKKIIKIFTVVGIISLFCMLFAGCDMLDEMKANHARLSEDMEKINFRGDIYLKLPEGASPYVSSNYDVIFTTKSDVPVLLSEDLGFYTDYDPLRGLLKVSMSADDSYEPDHFGYLYDTGYYTYYCIEDKYDKYIEILSTSKADRIGFFDHNEVYDTAVLSSGTSKEIIEYMTSAKDMTAQTYEEAMRKECDFIDQLYRCDKEIVLREDIYNYSLSITEKREVYFVNHTTATAVKLCAESAEDITTELYDY